MKIDEMKINEMKQVIAVVIDPKEVGNTTVIDSFTAFIDEERKKITEAL